MKERIVRQWMLLPALAATVLTALGGAGAFGAEAAHAHHVVVEPRAGQEVRAHPLKIVVRARDRLFDLKARLNGRSIARDFGRTRNGKRTAWISASHALKRGRNVLRVRVRRRGRWVGQTVRFRIAHNRPLAGAGRDRRIIEDARVRIRGSVVRSRRDARRVHYRWTLVGKPKRSELGEAAGKAGGSQRWTRSGRRPSFVPDEIGTYTFKLKTRQGPRSSVDTVELDAVPGPLVPVETMPGEAQSGKPAAVRVGDRTYAPDAIQNPWIQVIVLDRKTLEPAEGTIKNATYACPSAGPCDPQLARDLSGLDDTVLVIAVSHAGFTHPYALGTALGRIGFPGIDPRRLALASGGTVSAIGVPGLALGEADVNFVAQGNPGDGNMVGYLTPDVYNNYAWLPPERPLFDTRADGDGPNQNTIAVDGKSYVGTTDPGLSFDPIGAFNVHVFDGHTLAYRDGDAFMTDWAPSTTSTEGEITRLTNFLTSAVRPGDAVFISSLDSNAPPLNPGHSHDPAAYRAAAAKLTDVVISLGATRDTFLRAATTPHSRYSLVGWGGAGEGAGEETSALSEPDGDGRLRGALMHDRRSQFRPLSTSELAQPSETLSQLVLQRATKWPLDGDAGAQRAIKWIGSRESLKKLGPDPRSAYWIQGFDESTWDQLAGIVADLTYPGDGNGFTKADFTKAQSQLHQELVWVGDVRAYMAKLSQPFADNALPSWIKLNAIADDVAKALKPPDRSAEIFTLELWEDILDFALLSGSKPVEVMAETYGLAAGFLTQEPDGSEADEVRARATELAGELIARLKENQTAASKLGDIIVSDHAKLREVGTNALCNPSSPSCPPEYAFTASAQTQASVATYRAVESEFAQALMALAFPTYTLPLSGHTRAEDYFCPSNDTSPASFSQPFEGAGSAQAALMRDLSPTYQVTALGADLGGGAYDSRTPQLPPSSVVSRMFSPVSTSLKPTDGGLGIYAPDYLRAANPRPFPAGFHGVSCFWK